MTRALIGHTGFVGSTLKAAEPFSHLYNSSNFREMTGQSYDEVVCAGVSAVKWLANKEPERDWLEIQALLDVLASIKASRITLISTIDVYPDPSLPMDERSIPSIHAGQPYGRHRLAIENFVSERFKDVLIARLPALFGIGLKKNMIFDLLKNRQTEAINPAGIFQWYPVARLSSDLASARNASLSLVNLFTEPLKNQTIIESLFPDALVGAAKPSAQHYRLRTIHAEILRGRGDYIMSADEVLSAITVFVNGVRNNSQEHLAQ